MKHYLLISLIGISLISITGCYTQLATNNDDSEVYDEPIVVPDPDPLPPPFPGPPQTWDQPPEPQPDVQLYKYRKPQTDRSSDSRDREPIRNTGGRNNYGGRGR